MAGRTAAGPDSNRAAAARLPPGPPRPYSLHGRAAHPGLGLRRLRPEPCRSPDQRTATQTRSRRRPADHPHRARSRLHNPAARAGAELMRSRLRTRAAIATLLVALLAAAWFALS